MSRTVHSNESSNASLLTSKSGAIALCPEVDALLRQRLTDKNEFVRETAMELSLALKSGDAAKWIKGLLSDYSHLRRDAMLGLLLEMGQLGADLLLAVIKEEHIRLRRKRQFRVCLSVGGLFGVVLPGVATRFFATAVIGSILILLRTVHFSSMRQGILALARSKDVRAIPLLLEVFEYSESDVKSAARDGLIEFLPMLCVSDSSLLTENHRKILNQALGNRDKPLQLAILKALEQIGDPSSLPAVQEILDFPYADSYRDLQESASQCIGFIRMNSDEVQNAQTLLRASDYNELQYELLRPAYHTDDTPSNELLRPESKPDSK